MNITVLGGGNIGTLMAAEMAYRGHSVTIYTSKPQCFPGKIEALDREGNFLLEGTIRNATSDLEEAVKDADIIWITMPAQVFGSLAGQLLPYVERGQWIGVVPGSGGAEFAFRQLIDKGCIFFGLQRVHSIARLREYGKSVYMLGRKAELKMGAIQREKGKEIAEKIEEFFEIPCTLLPNYLSVTLTPSNPIFHTSRLYSLFRDYSEGMVYERNILFHEEWDDRSSEMMIACDGELQSLCDAIPLDLSAVESLCDYYESHTVQEMTAKIRSIAAFKGLTTPMKRVGNGWIPDFDSRYFKTDFPYGIKIICDICELFGVEHANAEKLWSWYRHIAPEAAKKAFTLNSDQGDFIKLYNR